jgi:hypothetical protein
MTDTTRSRIANILRAAMPPALIALAAIILLYFPPAQNAFYPQCPIYETFHVQCPGCGATRALAAVLRGNFAEALHFNALVSLLLPFATVYGIVCYRRLLRRKPLRLTQPPHPAIYAAVTITAIFTILRNLPLRSF